MLVKAYIEQYLRSGDVMILSGRFVLSSKGIYVYIYIPIYVVALLFSCETVPLI